MTGIFDKFNSLNILIIGDVMMDSYVWGKIERVSPEAPVPVVLVHKKENRLGGAANVALNVQSLGANPIICAVVGDDKEGPELLSLLGKAKLSQEGIITIQGRQTTVKTRIIAHNQHIVRIDSENDMAVPEESNFNIQARIAEIITSGTIDAIIFEDYDKGLISEELISFVVTLANQRNIITVVDPKKRNFLFYKDVSLFKPNLKELKEGLNVDVDPYSMTQVESTVDLLRAKLNAKSIMLTLSEHGVFVSNSNESKLLPAHVRNIADVSGAGDTVIATAAVCLAAGLDDFTAAAVANLAGGLVCEHVGVVPIDKGMLLKEALSLS